MEISEMLNISKTNVEKAIEESISKTKQKLEGLNIDRTCQIYNSYIIEYLHSLHILAHAINTKDLGLDYEHFFTIANDGINEYIIDLTYPQFGWSEPKELIEKGYIKKDNNYHDYLNRLSTLKSHRK